MHNGGLVFLECLNLNSIESLIMFSPLPSTKHADSIDLELEVDPLNVDHFSCTPLVRKVLKSYFSMNEVGSCTYFDPR